MKAIILAAGVGSRLGSTHPSVKCLLEFDGNTLLENHIKNLNAEGISEIHLCVGYMSHEIRQYLQSTNASNVVFHFNPLFRLGSLVSLWTTRSVLTSGSEIILMDADVLYHPAILNRLIKSPFSNCFLIDKNFMEGDEPVKICMKNRKIIEFRKKLAEGTSYDEIGESVGFFKFSSVLCGKLETIISEMLRDGQHHLPHEEALRELIAIEGYNIGVEDITNLPWIEIDYPEDVTRAKTEVLPRILAE
jgi:choline kinase